MSPEPVNEPHFDCCLKVQTGITGAVSHFEPSQYCKGHNQPENSKPKPIRKYSVGRHAGSSLKDIAGLKQRAEDGLQILQRTLLIKRQQNKWIKHAAQKLIRNKKRLELLEAEVRLIRQQYRKLELRVSCQKNTDISNEAATTN